MYFRAVSFSRDTNSMGRFADSPFFRAIRQKPEEDDLVPDSIGEPPQVIKNILKIQEKERVKKPTHAYYIPGHTPEDLLNAPAIDRDDPVITLPAEEAEEAEIDLTGIHRNPEFIEHLRTPGYDNATTAGTISDPLVAEHVNRVYALAVPGLELVKSKGGRGGEGGAGYKLTLDGVRLDHATEEKLRQTKATLQELHTNATGRTARRIERDIGSLTKALATYPAPMVGGGAVGATAEAESSASESESESEEDAPAPAPAPAYTGAKYTLHGGTGGERDMTTWNREKTQELAGSLGLPNTGFKKLVDLKKTIVEHTKGGTA